MSSYTLRLSAPRPYFAEIPYYLWGEVNYDSDGDCERPTDRHWTWLHLSNRDTHDAVTFDSDGEHWTIEGPDPFARRAAQFLVERCGAIFSDATDLNFDDPEHSQGLARASKVAVEFDAPQLKPFDSHLFWGSWKWIGWFGTEFTWAGRWIMHSVLRNDSRAVSLCIYWLKEGTYSEEQSAALRYALSVLTGAKFDNDQQWLKWYEGGFLSRGNKLKYPEPDYDSWLTDLKAQSSVG